MKKTDHTYNLITATATVVGSVIGSGVFFKAEELAKITRGNVVAGAAAWGTGAVVMLLCLSAFAMISKTNGGGLYSMAKSSCGEKYSLLVGVFTTAVYYPSLVGVLSYLCARYSLISCGVYENSLLRALLSFLLIVTVFVRNSFLPSISGKIQAVTTLLKLVPLGLMIAIGIPKGISSGILRENFFAGSATPFISAFFPAVTATLFAYEGWISATGIGKNLKNGRKNLPVALASGGIIITAVYILYYLGITGAVESKTLINYGADGIKIAFSNIAGKCGTLLAFFVSVSCFGALDALSTGCINANNEFHGAPRKSFIAGLVTSVLWLFWLLGEQKSFAGKFHFDGTELPVVTVYALYIPIFFRHAMNEKKKLKKLLYYGGITASAFALFCGIYAHYGEIITYLCVLTSIILFASLFHKKTG